MFELLRKAHPDHLGITVPRDSMPLAYLYCFPLESLRSEFLPKLNSVARGIPGCELLTTVQGNSLLPPQGAID